ncbi:unnamed protein product [Camellia sinensis]
MYRMECEKVETLVSGEIDCKDFKTKLLCHEQASNYQRKHWYFPHSHDILMLHHLHENLFKHVVGKYSMLILALAQW